MKHNYDDYILLSAYLDNELSDSEKEYIEKRLQTSVELRNKLEELKRVKETTADCKTELPSNDYFEQKVMSALLEDKPKSLFSKKWVPAFGVAVASLVIILSLNINFEFIKSFFENQKNLSSDYAGNLKPLFLPSEITSEDLFNFALYEELPLKNYENQVLRIGLDNSGKEYFEVKKSEIETNYNNLNNFLSKLNLTENKKSKVDSLFKDYANQLSKHILVGSDNAIAINSAVWNLRKAMLADFISLTRELDTKNFDRLASLYNLPIPKKYVAWNKALDSIHTNKYIVFTPDSVFTSELNLTPQDLAELNLDKKFFRIDFDSLFTQRGGRVKIVRSPDFVQVQVEEIEIPDIQIPDLNSFVELIEKSIKNQPNLNLVTEENLSITRNNKSKEMIFPRNDVNLDSMIDIQSRRFENSLKKQAESGKNKKDNLQSTPEKEVDNKDSNEDLKIQLEKLREEIRKFREQFHNYIKEDTTKSKKEQKPVIDDNIEI